MTYPRIGLAYVLVFAVFGAIFSTRAHYLHELGRQETEHQAAWMVIRQKYEDQADRIEKRVSDRERAIARAGAIREYHRGKYESCIMHYVYFGGTSLNCNRMVTVGYQGGAHNRAPLPSWEKLWAKTRSAGKDSN